jgi:hypothetical protein
MAAIKVNGFTAEWAQKREILKHLEINKLGVWASSAAIGKGPNSAPTPVNDYI